MRTKGLFLLIGGIAILGGGVWLAAATKGEELSPYASHIMLYVIAGICMILSGGAILLSHKKN